MKNFLWSLLAIFLLISYESRAATVTSSSQTTAINFGKVAPGTSVGTVTAAGVVTGGVKKLGGNVNGSFSINATNTSTATSGLRIIIFLSPRPTSMTGTPGGTLTLAPTITSPLPSGCTQVAVNTRLQCTNPTTTNGNVKNWVIPFYATASAIATTQTVGNYVSGSYSIVACSCCSAIGTPALCTSAGCPTLVSDYRCTTAGLGRTLTGTIPLRIITALSITAGTNLAFGTVAASGTAGTITQAGAVTGGVTAISSTRSAGTFTVSGETNGTPIPYTFTLPATTSLTGPGTAMVATLSYSSGSGARTLSAGGTDTVTINGRLAIGANQTLGTYTGTYNVTVNY